MTKHGICDPDKGFIVQRAWVHRMTGGLRLKHLPLMTAVFFLMMLSGQPAYANNPPGTIGEVLFAYMIPIAMMALTLIGGGYTIIRRLDPAKAKPAGKLKIIMKTMTYTCLWVFAIFYSLAFGGVSLFLCLLLGLIALYRSYKLIRWGLTARRNQARPDYLDDAKPFRLISAGVALMVVTAALAALAAVFMSYGISYGTSGYAMRLEESFLKKMVAIEVQKLPSLENETLSQKELATLSELAETQMGNLPDAKRRYVVLHQADKKGFSIFLLPRHEGLIFSYPSYRADYNAEGKGQIRRAWVRSRNERCPENAAVIQDGL